MIWESYEKLALVYFQNLLKVIVIIKKRTQAVVT